MSHTLTCFFNCIIKHLTAKLSFYPTCPTVRAKVDFLLNFDLGTLYKSLGEFVYPQVFKQLPPDEEKAGVFAEKLQFLNDHLLKQGGWLAGDSPTIADISIGCSLTMPGFISSKLPKQTPRQIISVISYDHERERA